MRFSFRLDGSRDYHYGTHPEEVNRLRREDNPATIKQEVSDSVVQRLCEVICSEGSAEWGVCKVSEASIGALEVEAV